MYLPDINYVAWIPCGSLPHAVAMKADAGLPVAITATCTPIDLVKEAEATAASAAERHSLSESVTLRFLTSTRLPARTDLAFVIRDNSGSAFLIGAHERPYPLVRKQWSTGAHDGQPACWTVEVTLTAPRAFIPCSL